MDFLNSSVVAMCVTLSFHCHLSVPLIDSKHPVFLSAYHGLPAIFLPQSLGDYPFKFLPLYFHDLLNIWQVT